MAIQFLCPHCSATITVPNSSHGKRGTCPACRKKLLVPRPVGDPPIPQPASVTAAASAAVAQPPVSQQPVSQQPAIPAHGIPAPAALAPPVPAAQVALTPTALVAEPPKSMAASLSRKRRKRSANAAFTIGIPLVCFVLFVSVMAAIFWHGQPELKGKITGAILPNFDLPSSQLSLGNLQLKAGESETVAAEFDQDPERFISAMMKCSIGTDGRQLTVKVVPADGYEWFTVNPSSNANLLDWAKKNAEVWDAKRKTRMQQVAADLCRDKLKRAAGERVVINAALYRDEFALATQVKGFGYLVEAIGGTQRAVCAHEDANGTLYFALPKSTQSFVLQGRSFDKQPPVFPGSYTVIISPTAASDLEISTDGSAQNNSPPPTDTQDSGSTNSSSDDSFEDLDAPSPDMNMDEGSMSGEEMSGEKMSGSMMSGDKTSSDKMTDEPMMMKQ